MGGGGGVYLCEDRIVGIERTRGGEDEGKLMMK